MPLLKNDQRQMSKAMIKLNASNVAAFIGQHRYCSQTEAFDRVIIDMGLVSKVQAKAQEKAKAQLKIITEMKQEFKDAINSIDDESLENKTQMLQSKIEQLKVDPDFVSSVINKCRGIKLETASTDKFEQSSGRLVVNRNSKCYIYRGDGFMIAGKCDGIIDNDAVVETKTRRTYWNTVPYYDIIQLRVYMKLTGQSRGYLNEQFNNGTSRCTVIEDCQWQEIEDAIMATLPIFWNYVQTVKNDG